MRTRTPAKAPLVALVAGVEAAFEAEFNRRMHASDMCALSLAHSRNVLRHLADGPKRASQLVELTGITKQALSQQIAYLADNEYVAVEPDPSDQRARTVALTDKGVEAQVRVKRYFVEIERDWARAVGPDNLATAREVLAALLVHQGRQPC